MALLPSSPEPRAVMSADGMRIATYDAGDPEAPVVLAVHGFASSAYANFVATGWVRELTRAGYRVLSYDQRGHGASSKPHQPESYTMDALVADAQTVLDTYLVDDAAWVGYSLGARVGWHAALGAAHLISRAVFGGIPDGDPLTRFRVDQAHAYLADGIPIDDRLTRAYFELAEGSDNDPDALVALVAGMRGGPRPDPAHPPSQHILFAAGTEDPILDAAQSLAAAAPNGEFFAIPGRNHFNAPTSREFRDRAVAFLER